MFENIGHFFKRMVKTEQQRELGSKDSAKERLHLVLMQDRANVSADFLELMKEEIIDVIKKYIVVDEDLIDVRLTNQPNEDGTNGAPALLANIPIVNIKNDMMAEKIKSFKGVDFNKEMGIPMKDEPKENEPVIPQVIELSSSYEPTVDPAINKESEEQKEMFEEFDEDDDDDDVTFDDLLKAAEEADRELKENKEKETVKPKQTKKKTTNTSGTRKTQNRNGSRTTKKTGQKKNK